MVKSISESDRNIAYSALNKEVMKINGEIERVKGLKRYVLLEATFDFYKNNRPLVKTAFIAGALGVASGLVGRVSGVAAGTAATIAKKRGWVGTNKKAGRLGRMIQRDL